MQGIYDINDEVKIINQLHGQKNKTGIVIKVWSGDVPSCLVRIENEEYQLDESELLLV